MAEVQRHAAFRAGSPLPKLFVNAEPGRMLVGPRREICRWPNQHEGTVPGLHYIQEDSAAEIARAAALLEEELLFSCTQAMLQGLEPAGRLAFTLGALCDLDTAEAAYTRHIRSDVSQTPLSRSRGARCVSRKALRVAHPENRCRCAFQVNINVTAGRLDPDHLHYASRQRSPGEVLSALRELRSVRRSLEIFQGQPAFEASEELTHRMRAIIASTSFLGSPP